MPIHRGHIVPRAFSFAQHRERDCSLSRWGHLNYGVVMGNGAAFTQADTPEPFFAWILK